MLAGPDVRSRLGSSLRLANLPYLEVLALDNSADIAFVLHYCFVDPAVVVPSPEVHHSGGTIETHQLTVSLHLQIARDQVKVCSLFVVRPVWIAYRNFR